MNEIRKKLALKARRLTRKISQKSGALTAKTGAGLPKGRANARKRGTKMPMDQNQRDEFMEELRKLARMETPTEKTTLDEGEKVFPTFDYQPSLPPEGHETEEEKQETGDDRHVTKDMLITEVLIKDADMARLLMETGMHCITCFASQMETLEEAALVHGIDPDELVADLNEYLDMKAKGELD